jgi:hypothetical protein
MFSTILQAKQIAESAEAQQGLADALSLLGQAHCHATTIAIVKSGALPLGFSTLVSSLIDTTNRLT